MSARRSRPRLLPVVVAAAAGLLVLKTMGLVLHGGYVLKPSTERAFARVLTEPRRNLDADMEVTGATGAKKDAAQTPKEESAKGQTEAPKSPDATAQPLPAAVPVAERQVLEKLSERRRQLEERARELDLREQLLRSAEQKIEQRLGETRAGETSADDAGAPKDKAESPFKALVTIYEAMKPRDAAKVFERMDARSLAPLVGQMNPRKFSEILAQMSPDSAEKLTQILMRRSGGKAGSGLPSAMLKEANASPPADELPRIESRPVPR